MPIDKKASFSEALARNGQSRAVHLHISVPWQSPRRARVGTRASMQEWTTQQSSRKTRWEEHLCKNKLKSESRKDKNEKSICARVKYTAQPQEDKSGEKSIRARVNYIAEPQKDKSWEKSICTRENCTAESRRTRVRRRHLHEIEQPGRDPAGRELTLAKHREKDRVATAQWGSGAKAQGEDMKAGCGQTMQSHEHQGQETEFYSRLMGNQRSVLSREVA